MPRPAPGARRSLAKGMLHKADRQAFPPASLVNKAASKPGGSVTLFGREVPDKETHRPVKGSTGPQEADNMHE